eukprot:m51a1_g12058 hypothetical protein (89) ;mRNA; f:1243-1826
MIGKELLDFGMGVNVIPLHKKVKDTLDFPIHYVFFRSFEREFDLSFSPREGYIKPGSTKTVKVKLIMRTKINADHRVALGIEGEASHT